MTVKELAEICNVHYNTMRKWLSDSKVKKTNTTRNAQFLLTDDVIRKAKKHFLKTDEIKTEKIDNILIQQLTQKDIQIVKQQEQIDHLQKLLENQQILTLKAQERVQLLENKKEEETESNEQVYKKKWQFWKKLKRNS